MLGLFICVVMPVIAQPAIRAVQNAASNIPDWLPNAAIAQGSLFVIYGTGLGPDTFVVRGEFPFLTRMAGTSVQVIMGGKSVDAILFYTGSTQVSAILPSSTPTGTGTVTVTYNDQTSLPAPITVVRSNLGIFTVSQTGSGDAIATLGSSFVTPANAINPGETMGLWGTGLGPVNFDETNAAQQFNMTDIPTEAYVGGMPAEVQFQGRNACCTSVDTVYVKIPEGVAGCAVPVTFKIGNIVSNTTTIPVASSGRTCTPVAPGTSAGDVDTWAGQTTFTGGDVYLGRTLITTLPVTLNGITVPASTTKAEYGGAVFYKTSVTPGAIGLGAAFDITMYGSCTVAFYSGQGATAPAPGPYTTTYLDAGASIGISGPSGTRGLPRSGEPGSYSYFAGFDESETYLQGGSYQVAGPGGEDVGSFSANLTLPDPLVWTNQSQITSVDRTKGVTVTWNGGDPNGYVQITGGSSVNLANSGYGSALFTCNARTADGSFTVPPIILLGLPPSGSMDVSGTSVPLAGTLTVSGLSGFTLFHATGIDHGSVSGWVFNSAQVTYK